MLTKESQFAVIWQEALDKYEATTKKDLRDPKLPKLNSVDELIMTLDSQAKDFKSYRQKNQTFSRAFATILRPVELLGDLAAGGASIAFPPSSMIFGAVTYLITACKGVSAKYDAINDLFLLLKDFTVRLAVYTREAVSNELQEKLAQILTTLLSIFALSRVVIKEGRLLAFGRNFALGSDDRLKEAVARLDKLTKSEDQLVGAETLTEAKRTGRTVDGVAVTVASTNSTIQEHGNVLRNVDRNVNEILQFAQTMSGMRTELKEETGNKLQAKLQLLLQPSVLAQDLYDAINKKRVAGTGDWIREEWHFQSWMQKIKPVLWISGIPGAGKSFLAASIISLLREKYPQAVQSTTHVSVGYFFFKDTNPDTRSFHKALCNVADQISQNDEVYGKYIASTCQCPDDIKTIPSAWRKLYLDYFINGPDVNGSVYIVLDGIDEANDEDRKIFLELVKDIMDTTNNRSSRIQLAMLGRPQILDQLLEALEQDSLPTIYVTGDKTSGDIVHYIQKSIQNAKYIRSVQQDIKDQIVEKLSSGAQGMFIWVDFMLQELYKKKRVSAILEALNKAPRGLNEMLRHVLEGFSATLEEDDPEDLNELLAWVTCAERPMKLGELDLVLKLRSPSGDGMLALEDALRTQFASFFSLTREDGLTTGELQHNLAQSLDDDGYDVQSESSQEEGLEDVHNPTEFKSNPKTTEVAFCHAAIGDFFRDAIESQVTAGEGYPLIGVNINEAKASICCTCLSFLAYQATRDKINTDVIMVSYVWDNWWRHFNDVDLAKTSRKRKQAIGQAFIAMFRDSESISYWWGAGDWSLFSANSVSLARSWLSDPDVVDDLTPEDKEWVENMKDNPSLLFGSLARVVAKKWLTNSASNLRACLLSVHAAIELEKGTPVKEYVNFKPTAEEILQIAEWAGFEKKNEWHRVVAMTMREWDLYDDALKQFEEALKLERNQEGLQGIAKTYVLKGEWKNALDCDASCKKLLSEELETARNSEDQTATVKLDLHELLERMAYCSYKMGDQEKAAEYYKEGFWMNPECFWCATLYIRLLYFSRRLVEIMAFIKEFNAQSSGKENSSLVDLLLSDSPPPELSLTLAARKTNEQRFLAKTLRDAAIAAATALQAVRARELEARLATLYYLDLWEDDKAIFMWQRLNHMAGSSAKQESVMAKVRKEVRTQLSRAYLRRALSEPKGNPKQEAAVSALERLALIKKNGTSRKNDLITANPASLVLGRWYQLEGRTEEAKACFRANVKMALQILGDDDPENDVDGYEPLFYVLSAFGKDTEAIGVFNVLALVWSGWVQGSKGDDGDMAKEGKKEEKEEAKGHANDSHTSQQEEGGDGKVDAANNDDTTPNEIDGSQESSGDTKKNDKDTVAMICDACGRDMGLANYVIYMCRHCFNIGFCEDCWGRVKDGTLSLNYCGSNHDWLRLEAPNKRQGEDYFLIGDVEVGFDEFKQRLREEWEV